jgi:hypothetical protein
MNRKTSPHEHVEDARIAAPASRPQAAGAFDAWMGQRTAMPLCASRRHHLNDQPPKGTAP